MNAASYQLHSFHTPCEDLPFLSLRCLFLSPSFAFSFGGRGVPSAGDEPNTLTNEQCHLWPSGKRHSPFHVPRYRDLAGLVMLSKGQHMRATRTVTTSSRSRWFSKNFGWFLIRGFHSRKTDEIKVCRFASGDGNDPALFADPY